MYYKPKIEFKAEEVLVYLRKSRSDDPILSVEEVLQKHETILDEWAMNYIGEAIPEHNKFREVVSGETLKERPEINIVLRMIESPRYKAVAIVEPQRLTRGDLEDIGRIMKLLKHTNTYIVTPQRIYNLSDEYDWDAFERELKRGNEFLEYTKKILNRGRLLSVSQGNYIGNSPPYGYDKTWVKDGNKKSPTLTINEEQANVVRMIFNMYVNEDIGRNTICLRLDELGIKPPKGKFWSPASLKDLLQNVHYLGKVKWNQTKTVTVVEDGEIIQKRPKNKIGDFLIYEGKHEAIISEELFNAALEKQGKNSRVKPSATIRNPLASLLFCKCGRAMSLRIYIKDGKERSAPRLICDGQIYCNTGSALHQEIIDMVSSTLKKSIDDFEIKLKSESADSATLHTNLVKNLEKRLKDIEAKELSQWEAQSDPDPTKRMPQSIFKQLNEKLLKEKQEIQQGLSNAMNSIPKQSDYEEKIERFTVALEALNNPEVSAKEKNTLLKSCIERIEYNRERPERIKSKKVRYYDPKEKKIKTKSTLQVGGNWTNPPIELDIKLKI